MLNKFMTAYKSTRYIDAFQKLFDNYNNSIHSTILFTPNEAQNMLKKYKKQTPKCTTKLLQMKNSLKLVINSMCS